MAIELQDTATFNGTITNTASEQLEVTTASSDYVQVLVDDGTTGNVPSQYDVVQDYYQPDFDDYMRYSTQTSQTAVAVRTESRGSRLRFTFTNSSGADDTYRIIVQAFKEI